jgi:hypothetical protein
MKTLEFVEELGKTYKVDTLKTEIVLKDIPASIANLERLIEEHTKLLSNEQEDLKQFKKLLDAKK